MRSKRILLYLFSLFLLIFLLASCGTQGTGEITTENSAAPAEETEAPATELVLLENGEFKFSIVRPEHTEDGIVKAATRMRDELEKLTGVDVPYHDDYIVKGEEHDPNTYEILIGYTNYPQSAELYDGMNYGSYRIEVRGNKIVIAAIDSHAMDKAVSSFVYHIEDIMDNGSIILPADYASRNSTNSLLSLVPGFTAGKYESSYTGTYDEQCFIYKTTTPETFNSYIEYAQKNGCTLYSTSEMGQNLGATLTNGKAIINLFYSAADKRTRIMIEDERVTSLTAADKEGDYKKVCDSALVQLGLEQPYDGGAVFTSSVANYNNGMGYIFRLEDGSFIIIDGGFNKNQGAAIIYEKLCELAPDKENIVIAAWIMSHQHGDHVGAFRKFTERYATRVKLERVIYNMPNSTELESVDESVSNAQMVNQYTAKYSGAVSSIAHPGQVHYIRNAKIEVLHTIDLLRPSKSFVGGNSFCIAVKITIEGQTFMFAGDSHTDMTAALIKHYGEYLKSDFCQVVHHGATGASTAFYQAVDPTIVLWPLGTWDYYPWRRYETYNQYLFESPNVKEIILAGHTDREITLPYTFPTELVLPEEIEVTWDYREGKN